MRIPDGTAAVCAEAVLVDESRSLGKPEKAEHEPQEFISVSVSQKTCIGIASDGVWTASELICVREYGCINR